MKPTYRQRVIGTGHPQTNHTLLAVCLLFVAFFTAACSTTSHLPEGEVLYTGIKQTKIHDAKNTYDESVALTEVEAALAYAPLL